MSTTPAVSARQAWRQLMRAGARVSGGPTLPTRQQPQHQLRQCQAAFARQASSLAASTSRRATARFSSSSSSSSSSVLRQPLARRTYSSGPKPPPRTSGNQQIKFWPFLIVIAMGSGGYMLLVSRRKDMPPNADSKAGSDATPAFSPDDVTVLFVLGGPGAGKGTQCARLVRDYGFTHLSAGDLLRAEQERPGSQYGQLIKDCIRNGEIVPMEVTIALLENAMRATLDKTADKKARFLIDGFPRKMDQALKFEEVVCPAKLVLFYDCPEAVMEGRLLERGKTSGRADDNAESIRKRFRTFVETSMPVVRHYEAEGRVVKVDATPPPDHVYSDTREKLRKALGDKF
ncbi:hypothetical protein VTJ83DRAFT_677 [Remersonia thermophila]|uniref:Uridylate kinase n=1 Tax=Remersonia thermophila TaxID=72144 RepID=A0ABR4DLN1_9PEZI